METRKRESSWKYNKSYIPLVTKSDKNHAYHSRYLQRNNLDWTVNVFHSSNIGTLPHHLLRHYFNCIEPRQIWPPYMGSHSLYRYRNIYWPLKGGNIITSKMSGGKPVFVTTHKPRRRGPGSDHLQWKAISSRFESVLGCSGEAPLHLVSAVSCCGWCLPVSRFLSSRRRPTSPPHSLLHSVMNRIAYEFGQHVCVEWDASRSADFLERFVFLLSCLRGLDPLYQTVAYLLSGSVTSGLSFIACWLLVLTPALLSASMSTVTCVLSLCTPLNKKKVFIKKF